MDAAALTAGTDAAGRAVIDGAVLAGSKPSATGLVRAAIKYLIVAASPPKFITRLIAVRDVDDAVIRPSRPFPQCPATPSITTRRSEPGRRRQLSERAITGLPGQAAGLR